MDLYLIRHADAVPLGERGITEDAQRPLSDEGQAQSERLADGLQHKGIALGTVVTSPLLRARQTADALIQRWRSSVPELLTCEALAPGGKRKKLARFIRERCADKVAVVGHIPDLAEWAAWLIGGKKAQLDLAKSGVAYITCIDELGKGTGTLIWLVTREWLTDALSTEQRSP